MILENDANAAALGEKWMGAGRDVNDLVLLTLGTGIGGGIISDGRVMHGYLGMAAEIGHMTVDPNGNPCGCGNIGCLEKHASATAISAMARHLSLGDNLTSEDVYELAIGGNERGQADLRVHGARAGHRPGQPTFRSSISRCTCLSGGPLPAWELFAPAMFDEVAQALVHLPQRQDANREGHARQRRRPVRRGSPSVPRKVRIQCTGWASISGPAAPARCWWMRRARCKAGFTAPHEDMRMERPLWAEQRPEDWWQAAQKAIQGVLAGQGQGKQVKGVGLSGQMHGLVLLDEDNAVIRPALIWCDQRSQAQVDSHQPDRWARTTCSAYTANPVLTGFTLPKLLWVRDNEPQSSTRARKVLLPKDYIRFELTGEYATEVSDASGTALFDVVMRRWSHQMLDRLKLDRALLPRVYESSEVTGDHHGPRGGADRAWPKARRWWAAAATRRPAPWATASSSRARSPARWAPPAWSSRTWTGRATIPAGRVHTFCHAVKGAWHVMGVTQGAGLSLQWFRNQLAPGTDYDALTAEAATAPAGAQGLFWLPYLMGERTPHLDSTARGGWIGLTAKHTRADLIRALLEGVCYSQKDCLDIIDQMGVPVNCRAPLGRRRDERLLAAVVRRRVRQARGDAGLAGRLRVRRGVAGAGGNGRVRHGAGSLPRGRSRGGFGHAAPARVAALPARPRSLPGAIPQPAADLQLDREPAVGITRKSSPGPPFVSTGLRFSRRKG